MNIDMRGEISSVNPKSMEDLEEVTPLLEFPDRLLQIDTQLPPAVRQELIRFLKENTNIFAWSHEDMRDISPDVITHRLSIDPQYRPVHQKRRLVCRNENKGGQVTTE
ncbi:unnamed protein product [Prunus armeniaca]